TAHAAATATPRCLEHQWVANFGSHALHFFHIIWKSVGRRNDWHIGLDRHVARGNLIAQIAHGLRTWADKGDSGSLTGVYKFGAFRKQTIAGVNGVCTRSLCHTDIFVNLQIGLNRALPLTDQIGFVSLEAV